MGHQLSTYVSNLPCVPICPYIKTPRLGTTGVRVTTNSVRHVHCPQSDSPMDQKYNFWQIVEVSILIRGLLHRNTTSIKAPFMKLLLQWSMCVFLPPRKKHSSLSRKKSGEGTQSWEVLPSRVTLNHLQGSCRWYLRFYSRTLFFQPFYVYGGPGKEWITS